MEQLYKTNSLSMQSSWNNEILQCSRSPGSSPYFDSLRSSSYSLYAEKWRSEKWMMRTRQRLETKVKAKREWSTTSIFLSLLKCSYVYFQGELLSISTFFHFFCVHIYFINFRGPYHHLDPLNTIRSSLQHIISSNHHCKFTCLVLPLISTPLFHLLFLLPSFILLLKPGKGGREKDGKKRVSG